MFLIFQLYRLPQITKIECGTNVMNKFQHIFLKPPPSIYLDQNATPTSGEQAVRRVIVIT